MARKTLPKIEINYSPSRKRFLEKAILKKIEHKIPGLGGFCKFTSTGGDPPTYLHLVPPLKKLEIGSVSSL